MTTPSVSDIRTGAIDAAGFEIRCVYYYDPPAYAVYRTDSRVVVQFADDGELARVQRKLLGSLTPLRGQINALIDGWHGGVDGAPTDRSLLATVASLDWLPWRRTLRANNRKRAARYDRRVADAIITALENEADTALALLGDVKNDIISERTSLARFKYLQAAVLFGIVVIVAMELVSSGWLNFIRSWPRELMPVWTAICGGTIGAIFSIAIGMKRRTILIDLQNRENMTDAALRVFIGSTAGGVLLCLLLSQVLGSSALESTRLDPSRPDKYNDVLAFVIGFIAGFFERLVPDLLAKTNLGTKEGEGGPANPSGATPHPPTPPRNPPDPEPIGSDAQDDPLVATQGFSTTRKLAT